MPTIQKKAPTPVIQRITYYGRRIIVGHYLFHAFKECKENMVFDFLPCIITKEDNLILNKWTEYFRRHRIPYCITEEDSKNKTLPHQRRKRLWKEKVI